MRKREKTIAFLLALTLFVGAILPVYAGEIEEVSAEGEKSANKKSSRNLRTLKNLYRLN